MTASLLLLSLYLSSPVFLQEDALSETLHLAESKHEILLLLIEKKEFEKIPQVAGEVFRLPFPPEKEHLVVKEVEILSDALIHHKQYAIAHRILDDALTCVETSKAKAQLHREKAYIFRKEGKNDEAMEEFEKSVALESVGKP